MKVREGSERAAAQTLDEEEVGGLEGAGGEFGEVGVAWPCLGACRCSCRAFARAFSWVRTKYAKFWSQSVSRGNGATGQREGGKRTHSYENLSILCVHDLWIADDDCI